MAEERQRDMLIGGELRRVTEVGFSAPDEPWIEYLLNDGTVLKVRTVLMQALRVEGFFDAAGRPVYNVETNTIYGVSPPAELCQLPGDES